jgi:acetyl esterase/lipase
LEQDDLTFGGRVRLTAAILLLCVSILIVIPAPLYPLWKLEIAATEWSPYLALASLLVLLPGWRYGRYSIHSSMLALLVFCIDATPLLRAFDIAETLPSRLEQAFGTVVPHSLPDAPALNKPLTLRLLYESPPAPNVDVKTLIYASRISGFLSLDLYKSTAVSSPRPVVVVVHGGSWHGGDREDLPDLNFYLASRGYAVAAISYRFAPQFRDPAQTQDLNDAISYLKSNAAPLGIDPKMIALLGRSAGGHMVLLSAYKNADPAIRGVVALYPPTDQVFGYQNPSHVIDSRRILQDYLNGTPLSAPIKYIENSPIRFVKAGLPPTLLIHGTKDELVSIRQSRMLQERLIANGVPNVLLELPWATHGCDYVFNGPCGQLSTYAIERFLAAVLR